MVGSELCVDTCLKSASRKDSIDQQAVFSEASACAALNTVSAAPFNLALLKLKLRAF